MFFLAPTDPLKFQPTFKVDVQEFILFPEIRIPKGRPWLSPANERRLKGAWFREVTMMPMVATGTKFCVPIQAQLYKRIDRICTDFHVWFMLSPPLGWTKDNYPADLVRPALMLTVLNGIVNEETKLL